MADTSLVEDDKLQEVELEEQKIEIKFEDNVSETPDVHYAVAETPDISKKSDLPNGKEKKDKKKEKLKQASVFELFMFATWIDWVFFMVPGFCSSIIVGCALPLAMLVFGLVTNSLINIQITQNILLGLANQPLDALNSTMGSSLVTFIGLNQSIQNCSAYQPIFDQYYPSFECISIDEFQGMITDNSSSQTFTVTINVLFTDVTCSAFEQLFVSLSFLSSRCLDNDSFLGIINQLMIYFGIIAAAVFVFGTIQVLAYQVSSERQVHKMRLAYYKAILRQNIAWYDENASGAIASRLSDDLDKVQAGIGDKLSIFFQWITTFFAGLVIGFVVDYRLSLVILGVTPFLVVAAFIMAKVIGILTSKEQKQYASAGAIAEEVLSSVRTVIAFGGEYKEADRYDSQLANARNTGTRKGCAVGSSLASVFLIMFASYAIAFWFGGWLISENLAQGGNILTVFFSMLIGAFSLGQAGPNLEAFTSALGAAGTVISTIKRTPPIDSASDEGIVPETKTATIEFKDVNHTYPARPDVQVLKNVSFKVEVGKVVALVGHSGCGKSTVIQLLQRFYDADSGGVLVGGHPVSSLNLKYLRSIIGVVSQEPVLFNMSIADNIRFGRDGGEGVSMEEIKQAARAANVHDFIAGLPNGYNTFVGDRGAQLSGGQKQRVAIARALIREPKILLLDEATSALDSESEALVQAALEKAQLGRTTLVIAHRLSTIQNADCIVCMDKGEIVEFGNHAELMKMEGLYYDMVTSQSQGGMEEAFIALEPDDSSSPVKSPSSQFKRTFSKQYSRQTSGTGETTSSVPLKHKTDKERQEEWDKELKAVSIWRLLAMNAREWWLIILGLGGAAVNGSVFPLFAIVFGEVLGVFALPPNEVLDRVHLPAGLFLVIGVVIGAAVFLKLVCFSVSGERLTARIRSRLFRAILRQEMGWFDDERNTTGSLTTRLAEDAAHVQGATGTRLGTLMETLFSLLLAIIIAFVYSWVMSLVIIGFVPILAIGTLARFATLHSHLLRSKKAMLEAGKLSLDSIENIRTVTSLNLQTTFTRLYYTEVKKPHNTSLIHGIFEGFAYGFSQSIIFLGYIIAFRFGAFLVALPVDNPFHEDFTDIFRVLFALLFGAMAVGQASAFAPDYTKAKLSANRIFAMLDREPVIDNYSEDGQKLENLDGSVNWNNITFSYPSRPDVRVLSDISLSVKPGQTLALVGPSGCGKSTIVSLMERFYDPGLGNVAVDGSDIISLNLRWLRSQIGIVSQEPILFDSSIADNIRYGANHRTVSDEEVIEAAKAANIHSFIQTLPEGYNTNAGEKGTQLSGGQKQRIAIARALIRNPRILLLDEATSALDTESERIVQEALDRAREGRTSIVIAHRLSTIYGADCIAVITQGKLVEMGTHAELLAKGGLYYKLNQKQRLAGGKN